MNMKHSKKTTKTDDEKNIAMKKNMMNMKSMTNNKNTWRK